MSLDSLTAEERRDVDRSKARAKLLEALLDGSDRDTSRQAKRLLKKKDPTLHFPDIEAEDAIEAATKQLREDNSKLQEELMRNRAQELLQKEDERIRAAEFDPEAVRKFMQEEGTTNLDLAIEVLQSRRAVLAEPTPSTFEPIHVPDIKEMWQDPSAWRQREAYKVQNELRGNLRPSVRQASSTQG